MAYNSENRQHLAEHTKHRIYESAVKLFSTKDYNEVSVNSIVSEAGVAKGSFYVHFASKDALVTAIIKDQITLVDTNYKEFLDSFPPCTPAETLLMELIGKIAEVLTETIGCDKMRAIYKAQISDDFSTQAVMSYNRDIYKMFDLIVERGVQSGEFRTGLPHDLLTRHLMMAIRGITYEWCVRYPDFDYKSQALQHIELFLEGLRGP